MSINKLLQLSYVLQSSVRECLGTWVLLGCRNNSQLQLEMEIYSTNRMRKILFSIH